MIAQCRAKCWIVQLKEENSDYHSPTSQRGLRGNIIIYPQKVSGIAKLLPPTLDELASAVCVIFVGANPPSQEWLRTKAKPLAIRPHKVRAALAWLKAHNPLYEDVEINFSVLDSLPDEHFLPVHVEHVMPSSTLDALTSGYAPLSDPSSASTEDNGVGQSTPLTDKSPPVTFDKVVITDVDASATSNQLRAAALRHVQNNGSFVQIPHAAQPANEFVNPVLFPLIYPTLFPYGIGGFEHSHRSVRVSFQRQLLLTVSGLYVNVLAREIVQVAIPKRRDSS
ncbi:hypothetical protein EV360DRAFT_92986 [Lentinula raphanica]|nr:hypothetical protein EV360DRAFT_92986 [Lentinula raphanica]